MPEPRAYPTLLTAAWRYRWLVAVVTGLVVTIAALYLLLNPPAAAYVASASLVLQEPVGTTDVVLSEVVSDRFVASQVEIMDSPVVSGEAATILAEAGLEVGVDTIATSSTVVSAPTSPLVTIQATHETPEIAIGIANAIADGYRRVSSRQATATTQSQLTRLDAQIDSIDERLQEINAQLRERRSESEGLETIEAQAAEAVAQIAALQQELVEASADEADDIRQRINDYRDRLDVYAQVSSAAPGGIGAEALIEEQSQLVARRASLQTLRDEVSVDAEVAPDAVALVQSATSASLRGRLGVTRTVGVAGVLGAVLGVGVAYAMMVSRRTFVGRGEPAHVLDAPLLADVPSFAEEGLESQVPVRDNPRSAAAEAYRFASSTLAVQARAIGVVSISITSATIGQGKTTTLVNTALAAAAQGRSVLVMDCDFGNQQASRLLLGDSHSSREGLTDVIEGSADMRFASHSVEIGNGLTLDVIGRGIRPTNPASALQTSRARTIFEEIHKDYDLVLIDGPPLLQVAYASTIAELSQGSILVVEHESTEREAADAVDRLRLVGRPILGYIYNRSPLRREMTMSDGSMMDILGDGGLGSEPVPERSRARKVSRRR